MRFVWGFFSCIFLLAGLAEPDLQVICLGTLCFALCVFCAVKHRHKGFSGLTPGSRFLLNAAGILMAASHALQFCNLAYIDSGSAASIREENILSYALIAFLCYWYAMHQQSKVSGRSGWSTFSRTLGNTLGALFVGCLIGIVFFQPGGGEPIPAFFLCVAVLVCSNRKKKKADTPAKAPAAQPRPKAAKVSTGALASSRPAPVSQIKSAPQAVKPTQPAQSSKAAPTPPARPGDGAPVPAKAKAPVRRELSAAETAAKKRSTQAYIGKLLAARFPDYEVLEDIAFESLISEWWVCDCGAENDGSFCCECGKAKAASAQWTCRCGCGNSAKFCSRCGKPKPAAKQYENIHFLLTKDGLPRLAILIVTRKRWNHKPIRNTLEACTQAGIPWQRYFAEYDNEEQYVISRIRNALS